MKKTENTRLIGGSLCLEFINTVEWRTSNHAEETLVQYSDLVSWSLAAHIVSEDQARALLRKAELGPKDANSTLTRAIAMREALARIFSQVADRMQPRDADVALLNVELSKAMAQLKVAPIREDGSWTYSFKNAELDWMLCSVIWSAANLLTSDRLLRVRRCSEENCGWLFLDMSPSHSRRWCAMRDCGNRVKARRHYELKRKRPD